MEKQPNASQYQIVTVNQPVLYARSDNETWQLNPPRRYIFNANQIDPLKSFIESISDLANASHYRPLRTPCRLSGARILVERYRERGLGDLLFLTGPLQYLRHVTGGDLNVDLYALSDRGLVLSYNPVLRFGTVLTGPLLYDDLQFYDYHWLIDSVTECDEEQDQLNVYDVLYRQLNIDPAKVDVQFKRPYAFLSEQDAKDLEQFMYFVWIERKLDLRKTGYYVVAPFSVSSSRSAPYGMWLETIRELSKIRPVVIVGMVTERMPSTDMTSGEFFQALGQAEGPIINAIGITPVRLLMALISKATGFVGLDSGPLYIAQAFRVPAISLWGTHAPAVRIGYDQDYMDLAIWRREECRYAPCFAWGGFPENKCPYGTNQSVCQCLSTISASDIMANVDKIETKQALIPPIPPGGTNEKSA